MLRIAAACAVVFWCSIGAAQAATGNESVVAVLKGGEVMLEHSGKAVFANVVAPDGALLEAWLAEHALQQPIRFVAGDADRYGRTMMTSDIEENMLRDGVVVVYATSGEIPVRWRVAEAAARTAKRGAWTKDDLLLTPDAALTSKSGFHVVEGTITHIYEGKSATYINFGEDWHTDVSVTISAKLRRSMKAQLAGMNEGARVRVRGVITLENGPMIRLTHADNLEKY